MHGVTFAGIQLELVTLAGQFQGCRCAWAPLILAQAAGHHCASMELQALMEAHDS